MAIVEHAYYPSFGYQCNLFYAISSRFGTPTDFMVENEVPFDRRDWSMPAMPQDCSSSWILFRDMLLPMLRTESTNLMEVTTSTLHLEKQAIIRSGDQSASIIENAKFVFWSDEIMSRSPNSFWVNCCILWRSITLTDSDLMQWLRSSTTIMQLRADLPGTTRNISGFIAMWASDWVLKDRLISMDWLIWRWPIVFFIPSNLPRSPSRRMYPDIRFLLGPWRTEGSASTIEWIWPWRVLLSVGGLRDR